ncbi:hypothetical protein DPMN_161979 [Dreissena polymorpha]|uniref:Uncharacterized protein n=1 Tax=Dreissena polymorpha TaxID=45954 RepID=A0A9D4ENN5_DREPO|nr:hypothetical protein DPMN_161979 [Dreissena polymorpha]
MQANTNDIYADQSIDNTICNRNGYFQLATTQAFSNRFKRMLFKTKPGCGSPSWLSSSALPVWLVPTFPSMYGACELVPTFPSMYCACELVSTILSVNCGLAPTIPSLNCPFGLAPTFSSLICACIRMVPVFSSVPSPCVPVPALVCWGQLSAPTASSGTA